MQLPQSLKIACLFLLLIPRVWAQNLDPTNLVEGCSAGSDSAVLAAGGTWTATPNASWLHLSTINQSGVGSTNVVFSFDGNPGVPRTGTLAIAGLTLTVTQAGSTYVAANPVTLVSSGLTVPGGVAVDRIGNVYIADSYDSAIKKWTVANNTLSTLVSSGLNYPYGVAVDSAGNVYIADTQNNSLKKWMVAGDTVTTLASGFNFPLGVAVDGAGNVYIADSENNAVEKWTAVSNTVTTLVSSGLNFPAGVSVDQFGNLYIADVSNNAIQEWLAASNSLTTFVATGLSYPYGTAVDGAGNVYIADTFDSSIKEWLAASHTVITLVSSGLNEPQGVAVDDAGNIYIADTSNNAIEELPHAFVDNTPKLETMAAGSDALPVVVPATANLTGPFAPVSDSAWLTITGVTNGVVSFAVTANPMAARVAHIALLGQSINVIQRGTPDYSLAPTNLWEGPASGSDSVMFVAGDAWAATPNVDWLHLSAANQSGLAVSTNLVFTFDTNPGATRAGTLTIAGQTFTLTQAGSTYVATTNNGASAFVDATTKVETAAAGSDTLPGVLPATANLTGANAPVSDSDWLTLTGVTNGVVSFAFTPNTMAPRAAHIALLGQNIAVIQCGLADYSSLGTTSLLEGPLTGSDSVVLAAGDRWTATPNDAWLHLSAANQSGRGSTNVAFTFDTNPGATRTGTLTIAGLTLTVIQAGSTYVAANPVNPLVSSGINSRVGVAVDGAGNVYIADTSSNAIQEWIAASNIVTTLVSSGLSSPSGVAVDGAGNVYIADTGNNAIKKWVAMSNTVISLVSIGLNSPSGVAVDGPGIVYILDTGNSAIKEWVASSGTVITLVPSGLSSPSGLAVDGAGNVYIADTGSDSIKEWTVSSGSLTTLVSPGSSYSYPMGVAVDGNGNVYYTDNYNFTVNEWIAASNTVTTLMMLFGSGNPYTIAADNAGNVYVTDKYQMVVNELPHAFVDSKTRVETAAAGNDILSVVLPATANLTGAYAPVSDSAWLTLTGVTNGVVSFAFTTNNLLNRTGRISLLGQSIAVTQMGPPNYFSLGTTNLLDGPAAGSDSVVLAANGAWTATTDASWLHLSAANQSGTGSTNVVFTFDGNPGATRTGTLTLAGLTLTATQAGTTYVASTNVGTLGVSGLNQPTSAAVDGAGNIYIADTGNNAIKEWLAASNIVIALVSSGLNAPAGVAVDGAGNVYIADTGNNAIKEWTVANNNVSTLVSTGLNQPYGIAVDSIGNVYIADTSNQVIKKMTAANDTVTTLVSSGLYYPHGVAVDGSGNVYIADNGNQVIKKMTAANDTVTALVSSGLYYPNSVAVDGAGNIYTAYNNAINELPHAFVDPTAKVDTAAAGNDILSVVLPATANLSRPYAPSSDSAWLTITGVANGVVSYTFTTNSLVNRTGRINLLGQSIIVTQMGPPNYFSLGTTNLLAGPAAGSDSVVLAANGAWTATTDASWLHLSAANQSGTGSTNVIFTFDANPGATRTGTLTLAGLMLTVTQAGATYVATTNTTTLVSSGLSSSHGVAVDRAGNVYIADTGHNTIKEWVAASNTILSLVSSGLSSPHGVAVDGAGNVYIADYNNQAIKEWIAANNTASTLVSSGLNNPYGVAVDGAGNVYIADNGNPAIKEWMVASDTFAKIVSSGLSSPPGVAVDGAGDIYVCNAGNSTINKWLAASNTLTPLLSLPGNCCVGVDPAGNAYIANNYNNTISELPHAFLDPTAKVVSAVAGSDALPVVLPTTANLTGPYKPASNAPWLTITSVTNGVVVFSFTTNSSATNRTANITLLGQTIAVTQVAVHQPILTRFKMVGNSGFALGFTNNQGASFTIWASTNLSMPLTNWTMLGTPTNNGSGFYDFIDLTATNGGQRFYRVSSP